MYNSNLDIISTSTGRTDNEEVSAFTHSGPIYYVSILGYDAFVGAPYHLRVCGTGCAGEDPTCPNPCEGTVNKKNVKRCSRYCSSDTFNFHEDASTIPDSPFPNCHKPHCECLDSSVCDGVVALKKAKFCKKYCGGSDFRFYTDAEDGGYIGCHSKHCECL
eukprot:m.246743 g.246743  ORF g.246743 m.246743 type:complete len:161 (-) comp74347_c0_seq1:35-517(-)